MPVWMGKDVLKDASVDEKSPICLNTTQTSTGNEGMLRRVERVLHGRAHVQFSNTK